MAGLTLYFVNATAGDGLSTQGSLQVGGTAPSVATTTTGWVVGTSTASKYALLKWGSKVTAATFTTTVQPATNPIATDCLRTMDALSGTFAAGTWTFKMGAIGASTNVVASANLRARIWHSPDRTGVTGTTEVTTSTIAFSNFTSLSSSTQQNVTASVSLPAATLNNEYLFVQLALEIDTASTNSAAGANLRTDGTNSVITTSTFTASGISCIAAPSITNGGATAACNYTTPVNPGSGTGPASGDTLLAYLNWYNNTTATVTPPAGWSLVVREDHPSAGDDALSSAVYALTLSGSPSSTYAFSLSSASPSAFDIISYCFRGMGSIDSGAGAPTTNGGTGTPAVATGLTTSSAAEIALSLFALDEVKGTGFTSGWSTQVLNTTGFEGFSFYGGATQYVATSTTTGNCNATASGVTDWTGIMLALVPTGSGSTTVSPYGITSEEISGSPSLAAHVQPYGLPSGEVWGAAQLRLVFVPYGITTEERLGASSAVPTMAGTGIASGETTGAAELALVFSPYGVVTLEAFGAVTSFPVIAVSGVGSAEAGGSSSLGLVFRPYGVSSAEVSGAGVSTPMVAPAGTPSGETLGANAMAPEVAPAGVPSAEFLGAATLALQAIGVGIGTEESFGLSVSMPRVAPSGVVPQGDVGSSVVALRLVGTGILSEENSGVSSVIPSVFAVMAAGIGTEEAFGALMVSNGIVRGIVATTTLLPLSGETDLLPLAGVTELLSMSAETELLSMAAVTMLLRSG